LLLLLGLVLSPVARTFWLAAGWPGNWFDRTAAGLVLAGAFLSGRGDWVRRFLTPALLCALGWQWPLGYLILRLLDAPWAARAVALVEWPPRWMLAGLPPKGALWPRRLRFATLVGLVVASLTVNSAAFVRSLGRDVRGIDGRWYLRSADTLIRTGQFVGDFLLVDDRSHVPVRAARPPGYPTFLAGCLIVAGRAQVPLASALQCFGQTVAVVLLFTLGESFAGTLGGLCAGGLGVAYLPFADAAPSILTEPLAVPLCVAVLWAAVHAYAAGRLVSWAVTGALLGAGTLLRCNTIVTPLCLLLVVAVVAWRTRRGLGPVVRSLPMLGGFLLFMGPWWLRNALVLHAFVPTVTSTGAHLWAGNDVRTGGRYRARHYAVATQTLHACRDSEVLADRAMMQMARDEIADNLRRPAALLRLEEFKIRDLVLTPASSDPFSACLHVPLLVLAAGGLVGLRRLVPIWFVPAYLVSVVGLHLLSYAGEARYFLPVMPCVILLAGVALASLADGAPVSAPSVSGDDEPSRD